jgi:hypothetical protein
MRVHPAFDPETRTWFTEEGIEAPSLRELRPLLPPGTRIVGYRSNSEKIAVPRSALLMPATRSRYAPARDDAPAKPRAVPRQALVGGLSFYRTTRPPPPVVHYERIDWSPSQDAVIIRGTKAGLTAREIAEEIGCVSRNAVIGRRERLVRKLEKQRRRKIEP